MTSTGSSTQQQQQPVFRKSSPSGEGIASIQRTWYTRLKRYFAHYTALNGRKKTSSEVEALALKVAEEPILWQHILQSYGPEQDPPYGQAPPTVNTCARRPTGDCGLNSQYNINQQHAVTRHWRSKKELHEFWANRLIRYYKRYDPGRSEEIIRRFVQSVQYARWEEVWRAILNKYGPELLPTTEELIAAEGSAVGDKGMPQHHQRDRSATSLVGLTLAQESHLQRRLDGARELFKVRLARHTKSHGARKSYDEINQLCQGVPTEHLDDVWRKLIAEVGPPKVYYDQEKVPREYWRHVLKAYEPQLDCFEVEQWLDAYAAYPGGWAQMAVGLESKYQLPPPKEPSLPSWATGPTIELSRPEFWRKRIIALYRNKAMEVTGDVLKIELGRCASIGWTRNFEILQGKIGEEEPEKREYFSQYREYWISRALSSLKVKFPNITEELIDREYFGAQPSFLAFAATTPCTAKEYWRQVFCEAIRWYSGKYPTKKEASGKRSTIAPLQDEDRKLRVHISAVIDDSTGVGDDEDGDGVADRKRVEEECRGRGERPTYLDTTTLSNPPPPQGSRREMEPSHVWKYWFDRLKGFYRKHCPSKANAHHVTVTLGRFPPLKRTQMWEMLCHKYGSPPPSPLPSPASTPTSSPEPEDIIPQEEGAADDTCTTGSAASATAAAPTVGQSSKDSLRYSSTQKDKPSQPNSGPPVPVTGYDQVATAPPELSTMEPNCLFWSWAVDRMTRKHRHLTVELVQREKEGRTWKELFEHLEVLCEKDGADTGTSSVVGPGQRRALSEEFVALQRLETKARALDARRQGALGVMRRPAMKSDQPGGPAQHLGGRRYWEKKMEAYRQEQGPGIKPQAIRAMLDTAELNGRSYESTFTDFIKLCLGSTGSPTRRQRYHSYQTHQ